MLVWSFVSVFHWCRLGWESNSLWDVDIYIIINKHVIPEGSACCWWQAGGDPVLNSSYYLWCQRYADPRLSDSSVTMASCLSDENSDLRGGGFPWGPQSLVINPDCWGKRALAGSLKIRVLTEIHYMTTCWTLWHEPVYNFFFVEGWQAGGVQNCFIILSAAIFVASFYVSSGQQVGEFAAIVVFQIVKVR